MKKKVLIVSSLLLLTLGGGVWFLIVAAPPSTRKPAPESAPPAGLTDAPIHSEHVVAVAETVLPSPTPLPTPLPEPPPQAPMVEMKQAPLRLYTSTAPEATPAPAEVKHGAYAPFGRMVRAKLVNTLDSAEIESPIIALVTDDLCWGGKVIIPRCSEIHGVAQIDKSRERVASSGVFTFVLFDEKNPGLGKELVVKGIVLDRESDPEFRTWSITDGSAGLRGAVITSDRMADIKLFVASFLSGIASGLENTQNTIFGPVASTNGAGVTGLSGLITNPIAQGTQAVLDRYAAMILSNIEKDGFFLRVPAGKELYVYITEDLDLAKATVRGASRIQEVQSQYLDERKQLEKVTEPRSVRDDRAARAEMNPMPNIPVDPQLNNLTHQLDSTTEMLQERSREMGVQSQTLAQPSPSPTQ